MNSHLRCVAAFAVLALGAGAIRAQTTERSSVSTGALEGNSVSYDCAISADGRLVAFTSGATDLVAGDTNATWDIFVRDRASGTTERVSVNTAGAEANDRSSGASLSADGRFVAFQSDASNLVAGDTNGWTDVFVHDRQSGTTERVSVATGGTEADNESAAPSLSADGRFVAFHSAASNLVAGDTNATSDIFVRDRMGGTTERVSVSTFGAEGNSVSYHSLVSADGRCVAFISLASNLVAGDTNVIWDVFVHDRQSGTTERVSVSTGGAEGNGMSFFASISADGRFVAFESAASNLVAGDTNATWDVFVRDRASATTERASVDSSGSEANLGAGDTSISGDGRYVAFDSGASNLVGGDTNSKSDVFVHDRQNGTTERVSVDSSGTEADHESGVPAISADGRYVAFESLASNLVASDTNGCDDVFVRDRGPRTPVVYCTAGTSSNGCSASIAASSNPSISLTNSCNITVSDVEGLKAGIVFYGVDNAGFSPSPWAFVSASWLCVKQPTQRTPVQNSGGTLGACDGSFALDWNAYQLANPLALGNPWNTGDKVYVQAWFRDPLAVKATNLSNALELTYVP
jgi:tricorn protease-like protein